MVFSSGWIDIGASWCMNEVMSWAKKLQVQRCLMTGNGLGGGIVFETLLKDSLHAVNVEEFKTQRALAGGIEALGAVAAGKTEQLLSRAEPAPGELAG